VTATDAAAIDTVIDLEGDLVLKPSVGAGANGVFRSHGDEAAARRHLGSLLEAGLTAMVQPYATDVDDSGETGLVFLAGVFSHAFGKAAILDRPVTWEGRLFAGERVSPRRPTGAERQLAERVVERLPDTAYARIDLLPTPDGPVVLEVEVTEPSLYLELDPTSPARAAAAFRSLAT
jgi:glutathione synthase/RimK-type ligase-like ATP-grasp enzyme